MNFAVTTRKAQEVVDITHEVGQLVKDVKKGLCNVFVTHATAAIVINENYDPNICTDFLDALNRSFPDHAGYRHDIIDNNAGAHIKAALLGPSETIHIENGQLVLGTWQSLMLVDLDGPKRRNIRVEIIE